MNLPKKEFCTHLTQPLPCKRDKTYHNVMMANTFKSDDVIYFVLAVGDLGGIGLIKPKTEVKNSCHLNLFHG